METDTPEAGQDGAAATDAAAAAPGPVAEPQHRQGTKVSQKKVDQVKVRQPYTCASPPNYNNTPT